MMKIPKVVDVYFEIRDVGNIIGSSLGKIERAISHLDVNIGNALARLHEDLSDELAWIGIVTSYGDLIKSLQYFMKLFEEYKKAAGQNFRKDETALAEAVLGAHRYDGIRRWLHDFNSLINGTSGFTFTPEEPILIRYMTHYQTMACTDAYKKAIDNVWRQLMFLQHKGYMMWIQALHILNEPSEFVSKQYQVYTDSQTETLRHKSCTLFIPNSEHINCSGGFYLNKGITVSVTCNTNFYLIGSDKVTCNGHSSTCNACNCNAEGSTTMQCAQETGKCKCNEHFYGDKCENRDCVWSNWSQWSACSMKCDHGGTTTRRKHYAITKRGSGFDCRGQSEENVSCFNGCCKNQYLCTNTKTCIPIQQVCDNRNDCGNGQDEDASTCCNVQHSYEKGGGSGTPRALFDTDVNCGNNLIREFQLERPTDNSIRYRYHCCRFSHSSFCKPRREVSTKFTYIGPAFYYLDRQTVDCGNRKGVLMQFRLVGGSKAPGGSTHTWKYVYSCCDIYPGFTVTCQDRNSMISKRQGNNDVFLLVKQRVRCEKYEYLSSFHLKTLSHATEVKYEYRCCKIVGPATTAKPKPTTTTAKPKPKPATAKPKPTTTTAKPKPTTRKAIIVETARPVFRKPFAIDRPYHSWDYGP